MVSSFTRRPLRISDGFSWYVERRAGVRTRPPAPGTFLGLPDPMAFMGDADFVATRWRADPSGAIAAERDGELVGSNLATRWGSFGFFGPLSVRPDLWDRGIARRALERTMEIFAGCGTTRH